MRELLVHLELRSTLRVNENEPQLFGRPAHEEPVDDRTQAHGLALSGRARNKQMWHF